MSLFILNIRTITVLTMRTITAPTMRMITTFTVRTVTVLIVSMKRDTHSNDEYLLIIRTVLFLCIYIFFVINRTPNCRPMIVLKVPSNYHECFFILTMKTIIVLIVRTVIVIVRTASGLIVMTTSLFIVRTLYILLNLFFLCNNVVIH